MSIIGRRVVVDVALIVSLTPCLMGSALQVTQYSGLNSNNAITTGPDHNLWVSDPTGAVSRVTTTGVVIRFNVSPLLPGGITQGPDGNLWITGGVSSNIGKMSPSGTLITYPIPLANFAGAGIVAGPDGNMWFAGNVFGDGFVGRITTAGVVTMFPESNQVDYPQSITSGPDGNLWFTTVFGNKIGRITTAGVITKFSVPGTHSLSGITTGSDGNIWFGAQGGNLVGRITTSGVVTEFFTPTAGSEPLSLTPGPDGNVWFVELSVNKLGNITPGGVITEFPLPMLFGSPGSITLGPDGNLWFAESAFAVAKVVLSTNVLPTPLPSSFFLTCVGLLICWAGWRVARGLNGREA